MILNFLIRRRHPKWIMQGKFLKHETNLTRYELFYKIFFRTIEFYKDIRSYGDLILYHQVTTNPADDRVCN